MTTVQVLSDLHFNQHGFLDRPPPQISPEAEVLVLAGDTIDGLVFTQPGEVFLDWYASIPVPIVYVLGNHEYDRLKYVDNARHAYSSWLGRLNPNTLLLEDGYTEVKGVTFVGSTLFTKLDPLEEARMRRFLNPTFMPDDFTGGWWSDKFKASKRFLVKTLKTLKEQRSRTVVVTHFSPSRGSISEEYQDYASNCYFANDLDSLLERYPVKYWVHGHTHTPCTYEVGETQVVCNPYGYIYQDGRRERSSENFNPQLLLEI